MTRLDLARRRELRDIIRDTFRLFGEHGAVFLALTLAVVAPVGLLVDGVWGRALVDGAHAKAPRGAMLISLWLTAFILPTLVTALHVRVVQGLARGEEPSVGEAFRRAAPVFAPALAVVALASAGIALGLLALIVPGVWLAVRWYLAAQAVVVEGRRGKAALDRSAQLVGDLWGHVFVILLASGFLFGLLGVVIQAVLAPLGGALYVVGLIVGQSVSLSLAAIAGTLLYFDLRVRRGDPWAPGAP